MSHWLRDARLRDKLMMLGIIASTSALVVASVVFLLATYVVARRAVHANVATQSAISADNVSAALAFGDRSVAVDTLRALRASPAIDTACVWTENGELFAAYERAGSLPCPSGRVSQVDRTDTRHIEIARPVTIGDRRVGALYIRANLDAVFAQMRWQIVATLAALLLGTLVAILLAMRVQRVIADPLTALAHTAADVSRRGDYSVRAAPGGADEIGQLVASFNDMLQQIAQRDEDLRQASRLKDEFLATLSHELRTPLNAMLGWLHILRMQPPSQTRLEQGLEIVERNAQVQARLVEDLLDISRIVSGKLQLRLRPVDVRQVLEAALDVIRPAAGSKRILIEQRGDDRPAFVEGDPDRLQQAIWNLLANAVKFSDAGHVTVALRRESDFMVIDITDTGVGIDPAFLPHIFERFRQEDASLTRRHGGLGLGLAIAKDIAEAHGGRIEAFSEGPGCGARFSLYLPAGDQTALGGELAAGTAESTAVDR